MEGTCCKRISNMVFSALRPAAKVVNRQMWLDVIRTGPPRPDFGIFSPWGRRSPSMVAVSPHHHHRFSPPSCLMRLVPPTRAHLQTIVVTWSQNQPALPKALCRFLHLTLHLGSRCAVPRSGGGTYGSQE